MLTMYAVNSSIGTYLYPYTIAIIFIGGDPDRVTPINDIMTVQLNHCLTVTHVWVRNWITIGSNNACRLFDAKPLTLIYGNQPKWAASAFLDGWNQSLPVVVVSFNLQLFVIVLLHRLLA